jgi:signal transduction histidine kinase
MTTEDASTIQDESASILGISGSDLLVLANRGGEIVGLQTKSKDFGRELAAGMFRNSMQRDEVRNWWLGGGHLYEVWFQPIYFGAPGEGRIIGYLALGHEIDDHVAKEFSSIVSSEIVFQSGHTTLASSLPPGKGRSLSTLSQLIGIERGDSPREIQLGNERYLSTTVSLSEGDALQITLSVLRSLDKATEFLNRLNRILLGLGLLSVLAGGALVFLLSHTFTKPLSNLVAGVRALEVGDFDYPLQANGGDEVGEVTSAFDRLRTSIQKAQTEQQQLEDRLRQAHKMEAVGRLAGGVAHDFNNLLTIIRGNSDLLLDRKEVDPPHRKYVEQIQKAADRAVSMTRQLLAFSRMQVLQPLVIDLNQIISEMSKMIPRLIGEHIEFGFLPEPHLTPVLADPGQMEQVILNLAVNARDAMPDGGKITIVTRNIVMDAAEAGKRPPMHAGQYVLLSVSDTGHGMDAGTKAHIFEPFFTTKDASKGTGLGLATVYGIVKQSGGFIWVESEKGRGATFEIYLPNCRKPVSAGEETSKSGPMPGGNETILVVEDETAVRELASEFLKAGGYKVLEARDGTEGLKFAMSYQDNIHLLLTDMVMPRMSGADLAQKLRSLRPEVRVIFMSGYSEFSGKNLERMSDEANALQKPFSRSTLLAKVREVLGAAPCKHPNGTGVQGPA